MHQWYVAIRDRSKPAGFYVRETFTFATEQEARGFARQRLLNGCDVVAGTINPHRPEISIAMHEILDWIAVEDPSR